MHKGTLWVVLLMTTTGVLRRALADTRGARISTMALRVSAARTPCSQSVLFWLFNPLSIFFPVQRAIFLGLWRCSFDLPASSYYPKNRS